jgi:signal transduction histidine kinase/DNA-binding response OmpR family regulator
MYRYRLEGYDNGWVHAGKLPIANYTKLPPGRYVLRVNATNTAGQWSRHVKTLAIQVQPPLWATWWAYALYAFLGAGAVYGFVRLRLNRERLNHAILLKEQQAEHLRRTTEWKARFFANITHEFRTPLTLIVSPLEQILAQPVPPPAEQLRQQHRVMHRNGQLLLRLINQLLDVSKLEAGRMRIAESRGDLAAFVGEVVESFRLPAEKKGIVLTYRAQNLAGDYLFDAEKWEKIAYNLLSNALKFTPGKGTIRVEVNHLARPEGQPVLQLRVEDSGIGIPAEHLPRIFERFYQVDDSRTRSFDGTGIGLVLVKELSELLGGGVTVESQVGKGSVFTVTLPVHDAGVIAEDHSPVAAIAPAPFATGGEADAPAGDNPPAFPAVTAADAPLVLVVEDHDELRDFITGGLCDKYRVLPARDGQEGWELARQELPDLVISDVMMPRMDGYALCERIKHTPLTTHIAVILLTAKTAADSRMQGLSAGANDYLPKPFNLRELQLRVANWLGHQQQLRRFWQSQLGWPKGDEPPLSPGSPAAQDPFLAAFYEVVDGQLANASLTIEQLALAMSVSTRTLHRKLSSLTGMNTSDLLRAYRLEKAAAFLQEGHSVSEAAYKTGFDNLSYFSRSFKARFSVPPSQYSLSHSHP